MTPPLPHAARARRRRAGVARDGALRVALAAVLAGPLGWGCGRGAAEAQGLEVQVRAENGAPIAGAQLRVRGDYLGTTNALGRATLRVPAAVGERVAVSLTCPAGFAAAPPEQVIQLPEGEAGEDRPQLALTCQSEPRDAVVLVHVTNCPSSLPVWVDGVPVGKTDALGFAHVHVRADADSSFEVSLDTSADEKLTPPHPSRRFQVEKRDELFVFEAAFERPTGPSKARRGKRRSRPG